MYHFLPLLLLCWRMWLWVEWEKWGLMQIKDKSHLYKLQQLDPHVHKCVSICLWGPTVCLHLESNWHSGIVKPDVVKWGPKCVCNKLELYLTTWCFLDWPHPGKHAAGVCMHHKGGDRRGASVSPDKSPPCRSHSARHFRSTQCLSVAVSPDKWGLWHLTHRDAGEIEIVCHPMRCVVVISCGSEVLEWRSLRGQIRLLIASSLFAETIIFTPQLNQPRTSLLTPRACFHNTTTEVHMQLSRYSVHLVHTRVFNINTC